MTLNILLIVTAFVIIKVVRNTLILADLGAEIKSYAAAVQSIALIGLLYVQSRCVARYSRRQLMNYSSLLFTANFLLLAILIKTGAPVKQMFYLFGGLLGLIVIAQFWSFANDIYTPEQGRRLFVLFGFGAASGGVLGPVIAHRLMERFTLMTLLLAVSAPLFLSILLTHLIDRSEEKKANGTVSKSEGSRDPGIQGRNSFGLILRNRYLLMIATVIVLTNLVTSTGDYILSRSIEVEALERASLPGAAFDSEEFIGEFYSRYYTIVGVACLVGQMFFVSRCLSYFGVLASLMVLPAILIGSYFLISIYASLSFVGWTKVVEGSTDKSLNNTVNHILFLPTTREEKYKAKVAIDSFFKRSGDVLSIVFIYVGTTFLALSLKQFAVLNVAVATVWLFLAYRIGKENQKLVRAGR